MNANSTKERTRQCMTLGRRQYQRELALPEKKSNLNLIKVLVSNTISLDRGSCLTTPWEYNQYNPGCGKPYRSNNPVSSKNKLQEIQEVMERTIYID